MTRVELWATRDEFDRYVTMLWPSDRFVLKDELLSEHILVPVTRRPVEEWPILRAKEPIV